MKILLSIILIAGVAVAFLLSTTNANPVELGAEAPDVTATNQDGQTIKLGDAYKKGPVVVYFYPKADTPGCTKQACSLRDAFAALTDKGVTVFGVSHDSVDQQKEFHTKYKLPFDLLADKKKEIGKAFGVPSNQLGMASRQAFLVSGGKIVWRDLKASTDKQAEDVLAALASLK